MISVSHEFSSSPSASVNSAIIEQTLGFSLPGFSATELYEHIQSSPLTTWIVNHNFSRNPIVEIVSPGGVVIEASVVHTSLNQSVVYFNQPTSGKAIAR